MANPDEIHENLEQSKSAIIGNENTTNNERRREILDTLELDISKLSDNEKKKLLANDNIEKELLLKFSSDENEYIRALVAKHRNTSLQILRKLGRDKNPDVRREVLKNSNTPTEILSIFALDKDIYIRRGLARGVINIPVVLLKLLSYDEDESVRANIASNINTPIEILIRLSYDTEKIVRQEVIQRLGFEIKEYNNLNLVQLKDKLKEKSIGIGDLVGILENSNIDKYLEFRDQVFNMLILLVLSNSTEINRNIHNYYKEKFGK